LTQIKKRQREIQLEISNSPDLPAGMLADLKAEQKQLHQSEINVNNDITKYCTPAEPSPVPAQ
jgi:hypothetical protein